MSAEIQNLPNPFPARPPGSAPARGQCPPDATDQQPAGRPPCRGMPPVMNPMIAAFAAGKLSAARKPPARVQLNWIAEKGSPRRVSAADGGLTSVFDCGERQKIEEMLLKDNQLAELFTRKRAAAPLAKKPRTGDAPKNSASRPSVLSPGLSQKYLIIVRCLRKNYDETDNWQAFKRSLLNCQLEKREISLLLEAVPEGNSRKASEWEECVAAVRAVRNSGATLHEDEEFVNFMSSITDLHQRLQCQLVMLDFDDLIAKVMREMEALADALEWLVRSPAIPKIFAAILAVGNFLNEGTALGKRQWFRLESLERVAELRAPGGGRSLMLWLASKLGGVCTSGELALLQRAAQLTLLGPIQTACHLQDIFQMLESQTYDKENGENLPVVDISAVAELVPVELEPAAAAAAAEDRFIAVGRKFVEEHRDHFLALKADARRLITDYQSACEYFGDADSLLPFDKKIEDRKCPGQTRFVPDLFQICSGFLTSYHNALSQVDTEKGREQRAAAAARTSQRRKTLRSDSQNSTSAAAVCSNASATTPTTHLLQSLKSCNRDQPIPPPRSSPPPSPPVESAVALQRNEPRQQQQSAPIPTAAAAAAAAISLPPPGPTIVTSDARVFEMVKSPAEAAAALLPPVPLLPQIPREDENEHTDQLPPLISRSSGVRTSLRPSLFSGAAGSSSCGLHGSSTLEAVRELVEDQASPGLSSSVRTSGRPQAAARSTTTTSWLAAMRQNRRGGTAATKAPSFARPTATSMANEGKRQRESLRALSGYLRASSGSVLATSAALPGIPKQSTTNSTSPATAGKTIPLPPVRENPAEHSPDSAIRQQSRTNTASNASVNPTSINFSDRGTLRSRLAKLRETDSTTVATAAARSRLLKSASTISTPTPSRTFLHRKPEI